jgi:hypothetical protein
VNLIGGQTGCCAEFDNTLNGDRVMLNTKRAVFTILAIALASPLVTQAAPYVEVSNGERAIVFNDPPSTGARTETAGSVSQANTGTFVANGWRYVGGEAVWLLESARYEFVDGQLVHSEDCIFKTAYAQVPERGFAPLPSIYLGA